MEEKIQDEKIREALNAPVEHTLRLPIEVVFPRTTTMGRLWQAMKRLVREPAPQPQKSLLDIAVSNLTVLSTLVCTAKSNTTHQQGQFRCKVITFHSKTRNNEQFYHVLHRYSVTLQSVEPPNRPCGLSRVQQREREWRCVECECE